MLQCFLSNMFIIPLFNINEQDSRIKITIPSMSNILHPSVICGLVRENISYSRYDIIMQIYIIQLRQVASTVCITIKI